MPVKYLAQSLVCSKHSALWPSRHDDDGDDGLGGGVGGRRMTTVLMDSMIHREAPRSTLHTRTWLCTSGFFSLPALPRLSYLSPTGCLGLPGALKALGPVDLSLDEDLSALDRHRGSSARGGISGRFPGRQSLARGWLEEQGGAGRRE